MASPDNLKVSISDRQIFSIALPIAVAILIPQLNLLINTIFLGALSREALGNGAVTGVYYLIFALSGSGFSNANQTVLSRYAGSGQAVFFKAILNQGLFICILFSLSAILFTYFIAPPLLQQFSDPAAFPAEMGFLKCRVLGLPFLYLFQLGNAFLIASLSSRLMIWGFIVQAITNVLFDYLLIFGHWGFPQLGFDGAAYASVISEFAGLLTVWGVIEFSGMRKQYGLFQQPRLIKSFFVEILAVAAPLVLQYFISIATWLVFFLMIESKGVTAKAISNTMRNVFGLIGIFIWSLASTTNVMVSNLIGQSKKYTVIFLVRRITKWSVGISFLLCLLLNIFPEKFFLLFGQDEAFVSEGIPVLRVVSLGLMLMSIANIWLNAVTGTAKTRVNLAIEIIAVLVYIVHSWYFINVNYISLAVAWTNDLVYWFILFLLSWWYIHSKRWTTEK